MTVLPPLTEDQLFEAITKLPIDRQNALVRRIALQHVDDRDARMKAAEANMREYCAGRGLDWDRMSDDERLELIDEMVHGDRRVDAALRDKIVPLCER